MPSDQQAHAPAFRERLWVPWWWWALAALVVAVFGPYVFTGFGTIAAVATYTVLGGVTAAFLLRWAMPIRVESDMLRVGSANVPLGQVTDVRVLSRDDVRDVLSGWPDQSAVVLVRGYVKRVLYVATDGDGTPAYLLISTRRPAALAAALGAPEAAQEAD